MTEVSVVIPTKNEEASIGICIEKIQRVFTEHHIDGEIVVADNSTDRTHGIAKRPGVRVVVPDERGYGKCIMDREERSIDATASRARRLHRQ